MSTSNIFTLTNADLSMSGFKVQGQEDYVSRRC